MNKVLLLIWGILSFSNVLNGQSNLPQERIFLDTDKSTYLTGETIWLKVYCLDEATNQLPGISKIAYIELLDQNAKSVIQEKIKLIDGVGKGQIFVGKEFNSGSYYLKGYTSWMRNFDQKDFFEGHIQITNPFRPKRSEEPISKADNEKNRNGKLSLNKKEYSSRESVNLTIELPESSQSAHLSVSVYKKFGDEKAKANIADWLKNQPQKSTEKTDLVFFPPEMKTPILSGKVNKAGIKELDMFIPGESPRFYHAPVGDNNLFHLEISPGITAEELLIWTAGNKMNSRDVEIFSSFEEKHEIFQPQPYVVNQEFQAELERMSINAQVANAYSDFSEIRGQNTKLVKDTIPFYGEADAVYRLDDYTRFPTLDEVFLEYVRYIAKRKRKKKQYFFAWDLYANGNSIANNYFFNEPALTLIDGVPVSDLSYVWNLEAGLVEKIEIVNRVYLAGDRIIYGIINLITYKKDFGGKAFPSDITRKKIQPLQQEKRFYSPEYASEESLKSRIPDYRNVLVWEPDFEVNGKGNLQFFTGDDSGIYRVEVNGITTSGQPFYQVLEFEVNEQR